MMAVIEVKLSIRRLTTASTQPAARVLRSSRAETFTCWATDDSSTLTWPTLLPTHSNDNQFPSVNSYGVLNTMPSELKILVNDNNCDEIHFFRDLPLHFLPLFAVGPSPCLAAKCCDECRHCHSSRALTEFSNNSFNSS